MRRTFIVGVAWRAKDTIAEQRWLGGYWTERSAADHVAVPSSAWLAAMGGRLKKSHCNVGQNRLHILKAPSDLGSTAQPDLDPCEVGSSSTEKGLPDKVARLRGKARGGALFGERCRAGRDRHGHWETSTLPAAFRPVRA